MDNFYLSKEICILTKKYRYELQKIAKERIRVHRGYSLRSKSPTKEKNILFMKSTLTGSKKRLWIKKQGHQNCYGKSEKAKKGLCKEKAMEGVLCSI